jgi:peptide/nickel transport system permease protein
MMYGGRGLILVGLASSAVAAVLGTLVGLIGAVFGGWVDRMTTWATDVVLSIPQLLPLMLIMVLLRPSPLTMVFVVGATTWPLIARLVRAEALSILERDYIEAARSLGASQWRILLQHLLPNLWGTILTASSNQVAAAMLVVATVSFLGFGLPPPSPNWAGMVSSGTNDLMLGSWWLMLFPGLAFILLQFSVNFIAEAIRSALTIQGGIQ